MRVHGQEAPSRSEFVTAFLAGQGCGRLAASAGHSTRRSQARRGVVVRARGRNACPNVAQQYPLAQKCLPQYLFFMYGNSSSTLLHAAASPALHLGAKAEPLKAGGQNLVMDSQARLVSVTSRTAGCKCGFLGAIRFDVRRLAMLYPNSGQRWSRSATSRGGSGQAKATVGSL